MKQILPILIAILCVFAMCVQAALSAADSIKEVYVDAGNGNDANPGTLEKPFRSIQRAADAMSSGDTCYIRAGTYRETVTPKADGVTFKSFEDEYVLITGLDKVTGWSRHEGNIVKAAFTRETPAIFKATQVFVNGSRMHWARYPNQDGDMLSREDMAIVTVRNTNFGAKSADVAIEGLPSKPENFWAGAYFIGVNDRGNWFTANKGRVIESDGNSLIGTDLCMKFRNGRGLGYLIGHLGLLDAEKEWHLQNDTLYLYPVPART